MKRPALPDDPRIEVILYSGDRLVFGPFELVRSLMHRYMLIPYALFALFLMLVDTRNGLPFYDLNDQALLVSITLPVSIASLLLITAGLELIALYRGRVLRIMASPVLAAITLTGMFVGDIAEYLIAGYVTDVMRSAVLFVFYYVVVETVAHLVVLVVFPRVLRDLRARQATAEPVPVAVKPVMTEVPDHVDIGGQRFPTKDLVRITAEGNYVRVQTLRERLFLPGPFGRAVDPLPERLGVRVSRSDWVALREVRALRREGGETYLDLNDGASVKVANTRQKMVAALLELADALPQGGAGEKSSQMG